MSLAGFARTCGLQSGGVKRVYLVAVPDIASLTLVSQTYTAATMEAGKVFKMYEFEPDTCEWKEEVKITNNCIEITKTLDFVLAKMSTAGRAVVSEIALASACGMIAIVEDNNGTKWVLGYTENFLKLRPLQVESIAGGTGKKLTDASQYVFTLKSTDNEPCRDFSGTVPII